MNSYSMKDILVGCKGSLVQLGILQVLKETFEGRSFKALTHETDILQEIEVNKFSMLITDIDCCLTPDTFSVTKLLHLNPSLKVVVISDRNEFIFGKKLLKEGAYAYLSSTTDFDSIRNAILTVYAGSRYFSKELQEHITNNYSGQLSSNPFDALSKKELSIAILFAEGKSMKQIRRELNISPSTLSTHKLKLFAKLKITSFVEFLRLAENHGVL
jgi:two-component system invasion response regulator UvrY